MTAGKHNFDRPLADNDGNICEAMCSRCGKTTELDGGAIPDSIKNQECKPEDFSQSRSANLSITL